MEAEITNLVGNGAIAAIAVWFARSLLEQLRASHADLKATLVNALEAMSDRQAKALADLAKSHSDATSRDREIINRMLTASGVTETTRTPPISRR